MGIKIYPSDQTGDDVVMEVDAVWASSMVAILKVPLLASPYPGTRLALASPSTTLGRYRYLPSFSPFVRQPDTSTVRLR